MGGVLAVGFDGRAVVGEANGRGDVRAVAMGTSRYDQVEICSN